MTIEQYLAELNKKYKSGISREHSYRGDFENLFKELIKGIEITNEPANVTDCGNPDYVITKGKIPVGYIEAKDIDKDINSKSYKEQFDRYRKALDNLIITNYIWFQFYQDGVLVHEIKIAELDNGGVKGIQENFDQFNVLVQNFSTYIGQTIKSSKKLAEMMAAKAKLLQNILERAVTSDEESQENTSLKGQFETFKTILIHDLTPKAFADIYAQTLAYGMFAARLHDQTLNDFSRQEAAELIPKSNPFLRKLFGYVAGPDIDERIRTTVDNLADVYRATDIKELLKDFGKATQQQDPIIHFYETFLAEYDPKLRKARGVWYTPEPVVKFIVRAIDDILKTEFGLSEGLADTSKTKITLDSQTPDKRSKTGFKQIEKEVHKVQILDPATGTGTFLAEVIKYIYSTKFKSMQGVWSSYVEDHLIPRLNGFELLMASYSMAHLKLDMLLSETGYKSTKNQRFNVFLTNSLEEHHPDTGTLFSNWLSSEANEANHIKRDTPVMCVIGNPPYAVSSSNKGLWIQNLLYDYKQDLNERKTNLDDDYIKFIRYGQHYIDKNGSGILAYISNNSFIDGITHRQMRKKLLESFDKIYIIDLHGNSKKKETAPDGGLDQNVFDIMQGVSINLFIKTEAKKNKGLADVYHTEMYGVRNSKYSRLLSSNMKSLKLQKLSYREPYFFFVPKNFELREEFEKGFKLDEIFKVNNTGIQTKCDSIAYQFLESEIRTVVKDFESLSREDLFQRYQRKDSSGWTLQSAKEDIVSNNVEIHKIHYKPFDIRYTAFTGTSSGFMGRPRAKESRLMLRDNIALLSVRNSRRGNVNCYFISNQLVDKDGISPFDNVKFFPLFIHDETSRQKSLETFNNSRLNLNEDFINRLIQILQLNLSHLENDSNKNFSPIDIIDYIYSVLYSSKYREKYKDFLKIDFPRIPYPKDKKTFWKLVKLGSQLREIHLLESTFVNDFITSYPKDGSNTITTKIVKKDWELFNEKKELGRIWINEDQYFDNIPLKSWEFYIGGYQPAQKWLKDRKGRTLSYEDILHYQKIIVALDQTDKIMKEIDKIDIE